MRFTTCRPQSSDVLYRFFDDENTWSIALDIIEEKEQYVLKADLPGIKKEDIKVSLEDNILTIKAERKSEVEAQDKQVHRIERTYGQYQRSLNLGKNVDAEKIRANYKDGVLELTVPKAEEVKPKTVDVNVE
jgi:HSP20 family protein